MNDFPLINAYVARRAAKLEKAAPLCVGTIAEKITELQQTRAFLLPQVGLPGGYVNEAAITGIDEKIAILQQAQECVPEVDGLLLEVQKATTNNEPEKARKLLEWAEEILKRL